MRVAQVVTYVSPDGAFGGPTRVALGQASALAELGHEVTVFAASPAESAGDSTQDGYRLRTFPGRRLVGRRGFATMRAPQLTRALRKDLKGFDVVHIHLARDLVTLPASRAVRCGGIPYVVQPHGMIDTSTRLLARPLDIFVTRPALRAASAVLVLTDDEDRDVRTVEASAKVVRIGNGIRVTDLPEYDGRKNLVLFLARLHARKRPVAFVEMATLLGASFPDTEFVMIGPDEGEADAVVAAIAESGLGNRLRWAGAASTDETDGWIASARAYVLPSFGEVFPMTILESFRAGTPVITTDSLGIAAACERYGAALITDGSPAELAKSVSRVLREAGVAVSLRSGGYRYLREELNVSHVANQLEHIYQVASVNPTDLTPDGTR